MKSSVLGSRLSSIALVGAWTACAALAQDALQLGTPQWDIASYTSLAVKVPTAGDDNYNAAINVRYRQSGATAWRNALPLLRVRPETVLNYTVAPNFAGSIFDLRPATAYDVELQATDPDGGSQTLILTSSTRALPQDPATPRFVSAASVAQFNAALSAAQPGDVITLADGIYPGNFQLNASGTAANPIVIRGSSRDKTIIDGQNCVGCVMLWIASSGNVRIERLTFRNGDRAIRFGATSGADFVVRRIRTVNIPSPIFSTYVDRVTVADSIFDCSIRWPLVYSDNSGGNAGGGEPVYLGGSGHVVAHNRMSGIANGVVFSTNGSRSHDVYGNDFYDVYDNALEPDTAEGNVRMYRNRFTNAFMPISFQPIRGGPVYAFRNEGFNIASQQFKFNAQGATGGLGYSEPSGVLAYHNTMVTGSYHPLGLDTAASSHNFQMKNGLFVGAPASPYSLFWSGPMDKFEFDYNAYYPDGTFLWNEGGVGYKSFQGLAAVKAANARIEAHGVIVGQNTFVGGIVAPNGYQARQSPKYLQLAPGSAAIDAALALPNINDGFVGGGPDMGAIESGCALPWYGPRLEGVDESNQRRGCESAPAATGTAVFRQADTTTKGTWNSRYGSNGYMIAGDGSATPGVSVSMPETVLQTWQNPSSSIKALRRGAGSSGRVAAGWTNPAEFYVNVNTNGLQRQVALYFLEWATTPAKRLSIDVIDSNGTILDSRTLEDATGGVYLVWNISGQVSFRIGQNLTGSDAALSGVFLSPALP